MYYSLIENELGYIEDDELNDKLFYLNEQQMKSLIIKINSRLLEDSSFNTYINHVVEYYLKEELKERNK